MTVKELIKELERFPQDMEVAIGDWGGPPYEDGNEFKWMHPYPIMISIHDQKTFGQTVDKEVVLLDPEGEIEFDEHTA